MVSRRSKASRAVLAWMVVMEPSWPVFMAWSMSMTSAPRTSPTTMRSGRMRRLLRTKSRRVISPLPSTLGGRVSRRQHVILLELEFGGVFYGDDAFRAGIKPERIFKQGGLAGAGAPGDQDIQLGHRPWPSKPRPFPG